MLKCSDFNFVGLWESQEQRFVSENTRIKKRICERPGSLKIYAWRQMHGAKVLWNKTTRFSWTFRRTKGAVGVWYECAIAMFGRRRQCFSVGSFREKKRKRRFYHTSFCCYYCYVYPVLLRGGFYPERGRRSPIQLRRAARLLSLYLLS